MTDDEDEVMEEEEEKDEDIDGRSKEGISCIISGGQYAELTFIPTKNNSYLRETIKTRQTISNKIFE